MRSYTCCTTSPVFTNIESLAETLKILSEPNRLRILCILQDEGEHCVCEFNEHMADVSQSLLSHHLADLREAGLVKSEKRGLRVYYRLAHKGAHITRKVLSLNIEGNEHDH